MSRRDEIKADEKVRIAKAYTQGKIGISEAAKQIGVHHTVIKDWMPNEKWLTDVTEFKWYEGPVVHKVYLSAMGAFGGNCWPLGEFCVSDFRQNQEYHVFNVHDEGLFPLSTSVPEGWGGMRAACGVNAGSAFRESCFKGISLPCGPRT